MTDKTPDLGNWFDSIFKKPWLGLVHEGEDFFSEDAKGLQAQAEADIEAAKQAAAKALTSHEAAVAASITPLVNQGVDAVAGSVPILGGFLKGQAEKAADAGTVAVVNGIINELAGAIDPAAATGSVAAVQAAK